MDKYIISSKEIEQHEGLRRTHILNENAQRHDKSLGELTGLSKIGFHLIEIQPGRDTTECHLHYHDEECVYILEGMAEALIGDETHIVTQGDFIGYRAGGKAHALKNTGSSVLKCIVVGLRSDHDVVEYPKLKKRIYRHTGLPWNMVDMENITELATGKKT